jgi:hypothetical protein
MLDMRTIFAAVLTALVAVPAPAARQSAPANDTWTRDFHVDPAELTNVGRNPFFILEPGYVLVLEDGAERLTITVLNETKKVDSVDTRIVEERETKNDQPVEISRNYYAISTRTNSVFYFGEDVDMYSNGKVTSHEGAWLAGVKGARFGLMMPGLPLLRARFYQEVAEGVAMDRAEIVSLTDSLKTPAGTFSNVLRTMETTPLESASKETKYYGRGVGLLQDGSLKLVRYGKNP